MRTTINLPDGLVAAAKARALADGRTFTSLVAEGLRAVLLGTPTPVDSGPLPAYGDAVARPLVDILDREALWSALDREGKR
ncbi:MAG: CopG family transcriptional regulator [Actinomycetota bacterium]|nr:CopG family transcriptional regulator [Actinomycetota bacterium]